MSDGLSLLCGAVPADSNIISYAQAGEYFAGILGTLVSVIALIIIFSTWRQSIRTTRLNNVSNMLAEMLKTHDGIASAGQFGFWDRSGTPAILLREFATLYRMTKKVVPSYDEWSVDDRIDVAYTFSFYGMNSQAWHSLEKHGTDKIKQVSDGIAKLQNRKKEKFADLFKGHQHSISHYVRNLFGMYTLIDGANVDEVEKLRLSKIVRTKLSNYDQAVLMLNIASHLGAEWERVGFVEKYKPFSNLPERFFNFETDFSLKEKFPSVEFEWENTNEARSKSREWSIIGWSIIVKKLRRDSV